MRQTDEERARKSYLRRKERGKQVIIWFPFAAYDELAARHQAESPDIPFHQFVLITIAKGLGG
jgi:hypothetical protein